MDNKLESYITKLLLFCYLIKNLSNYIFDNKYIKSYIYLEGKTKSVSFTHKRLNQNRRNLEITKTNLLTNKNKNNEKTEFLDAGSRSVAGIVQPGRRTAKHSTQQRGSEADDHHRLPAHRRDADTRRRR